MPRQDINPQWTRKTRNDINHNFTELYGEVDNFIEIITDEVVGNIINSAKILWESPVETYADLPLNEQEGVARMVRDTGKVYRFNGVGWVEIQEIDPTAINEVDSRLSKRIKDTFYYSEIKVNSLYDEISHTKYLLTAVPHADASGNVIKIQKGFANDYFDNGTEIPREFASRHGASLVTNASIFTSSKLAGIHIKEGVILQSTPYSTNWTLGFTEDNEMKMYPPDVSAEDILNDGVINAWTAFFPMITDGEPVGDEVWGVIGNPKIPNPRQVIAQMPNKDLLFLTCEGRINTSIGMTYEDCIRILSNLGVQNAYCLDGGGSAQTIHNNILLGNLIDDGLTKERPVYDFIYFKKPIDKANEVSNKDLGDISAIVKKLDNHFINKYSGDTFEGRMSFNDFMYLAKDKAIYGRTDGGDVERLLGWVNDRLYFGNSRTPLSFQTDRVITAVVNGQSHYVGVVPNNPEWIDVTTWLNGWQSREDRKVSYIKVQDKVTIRGWAVAGTNAGTGTSNPMFQLPAGYRPTQQLGFSTPVISGSREAQNVFIYPNGNVAVQYAFTNPGVNTGVEIDITFTTL
ncbi:phosphodiester glycosidase family protein [Oceanobacillus sojae]|uniref:Phosphodiester glycosidase domain-containing protein n=1 Tax=Oceanobacillus sojae TaxID=582851 RepID=A0A511ZIJ4_9BACI|nr:phosphodiester glycosidase family protein [Oceanobacillus sojae]GEN87257.1 hypothetical protein OSO01_19960 [Oceanobacillus sojae]